MPYPNMYPQYGNVNASLLNYNPQQQYQQPVNAYIQVAGLDGAQAYHIPPNSRVPAFDTNNDVFYDISTDANGNKTITSYTFTKVERQNGSEYATKEDFDNLSAKVDKLLEAWNGEQPVSQA